MTVESASYISQLDTTLPTAADLISEGDDHLRLTKTVLKTQFPNFGTTAIAASAAEVNYSVGVTSSIQTQLNSKAPTASPTFTGTAVLPATTSIGTVSDVEIATLDGVTSSIQTQINGKGAITGQAWTGAHSFAGATSVPTLAAGSNTTGAASTAFVQADFLQKFPNYTAPVNASTAELNYLVGVTGAIQPQLSNQVSGPIHAAASKTTPVDADELGLSDSAASWGLKKLTFANLKTWLGGLYIGKTGAQTMTGDLTVPSLNGGQLAGLRNKIINGGFSVNQRAYVSGAATTAGQYTLDRWKVTGTGGVTFSTTANKTTVTIPSGQTLQQVIEGLNLQTGTYVLSWEGTAQGRIAGGSYGASGTVTASITGGTNTAIEFNAGTVTSVQLEAGTVATPFEHRPYGLELALCQRYYYRVYLPYANKDIVGMCISGTQALVSIPFPVTMRTAPAALEQTGVAADYALAYAGTATTCTAVPVFSYASKASGVAMLTTSGMTAGQAAMTYGNTVNAYLGFSAEL